jgi:hypothetical protein
MSWALKMLATSSVDAINIFAHWLAAWLAHKRHVLPSRCYQESNQEKALLELVRKKVRRQVRGKTGIMSLLAQTTPDGNASPKQLGG